MRKAGVGDFISDVATALVGIVCEVVTCLVSGAVTNEKCGFAIQHEDDKSVNKGLDDCADT